MLLTSVTNHMSANVAAIPLLWLPPLALYLLSFVLAFEGAWQPFRSSMLRLTLVAVAAMAYVLRDIRAQFPIMVSVPLFLIGLFVICFFLHGELYARRPGHAHLTRFYLIASAGSGNRHAAEWCNRPFGSARELRSGMHVGSGGADCAAGYVARWLDLARIVDGGYRFSPGRFERPGAAI